MPTHNQIDLVEFPAADEQSTLAAQRFYEQAFGWSFTSYGAYVDTSDSGTTLGVNGVDDAVQQRMPMVVVYADDLEAARERVVESGGTILHEIYAFPGGRRFHFTDPIGTELAVWSE